MLLCTLNGISSYRGESSNGRCGLARSLSLVGVIPTWVIASHEPSIELCRGFSNGTLDA